MVMCWAPDCKHYSVRETCKFYAFPKDQKLRNKWIKLVRRHDEPGSGARLCSCHFPEGKKENHPVIFAHNIQKRFTFSSPERRKRRSRIHTTIVATEFSENEVKTPVEITSKPGLSEPKPGLSEPKPGPSDLKPGSSELKPKPSEPKPGPSVPTSNELKKKRPRWKPLNLCRICLTYSPSMRGLDEYFEKDSGSTIEEVLMKVMCCKIINTQGAPHHVCSICLSILKILNEFKIQFEESQKKLFGNSIALKATDLGNSREVELIVGNKNFNLTDVVIVDNDEKNEDYSQLINNISKTVSVEYLGKYPNKGNDDEKLFDDKDSFKTNSEELGEDDDENYETIIIQYLSDSEELSLHQHDIVSVCPDKKILSMDEIHSNIIEEDYGEQLLDESIESSSVNNKMYESWSTREGSEDLAKRTKRRRKAEQLREIEKYIIYETDTEGYSNAIKPGLVSKKKDNISHINEDNESDDDNIAIQVDDFTLDQNIQEYTDNEIEKTYTHKYFCKKCSIAFKEERVFRRHMHFIHGINEGDSTEKHAYDKDMKEEIEDLKNDESISNVDKKKNKSQNWKERFKRNPMLCQICGHISKSSGGAKYHSLTHDEKRYKCNICSKKFFTASHLKNHLQYKHERKTSKHLCPICGEYRNSSTALTYHMKLHTNDAKKYTCTICKISFLMKGALNTHLRRHMGDRRYLCNLCNKSFFTTNERNKHLMIHTGERPHKCKYCEKKFATPFNQKIHMMTHSGPHLCKVCFRGLADEEMLQMHIKYKHCVENKTKTVCIKEDSDGPLNAEPIDDVTELLDCKVEAGAPIDEEIFGFSEHSPGTSSDNVILQVLNLLDSPEGDSLKFESVGVD